MEGYRAAQVGYLTQRALVSKDAARQDLKDKISRYDGPYEGAAGHTNDWGPPRTREEILDRAFSYLATHDLGHRFKVRTADHDGPTFVVQRTLDVLGDDVIRVGLAQLGVRYVFGAVNPRGPAGGSGEGFDCSGLFVYCYGQIGIVLTHSAEAIRTDPDAIEFNEARLVRPGDGVAMWFPNTRGIAPGHASHIGMAVGDGRMLDTRNPYDEPVAVRTIETASVVSYLRFRQANGPLAA